MSSLPEYMTDLGVDLQGVFWVLREHGPFRPGLSVAPHRHGRPERTDGSPPFVEHSNLAVDERGFVYATAVGERAAH